MRKARGNQHVAPVLVGQQHGLTELLQRALADFQRRAAYALDAISAVHKEADRLYVYAALKGRMGGELHALALQTQSPEQEIKA